MGNLKDKYEVGDRVTYELNGSNYTTLIENDGLFLDPSVKILKIERPTYEVVEEIKEEEKKELLTEDERRTLKQMVDNINSWSCEAVNYITIERFRNCTVNVYFHGNKIFLGNIASTLHFDNLKQETKYTLEELGLEE